jgi:hypothetical protein
MSRVVAKVHGLVAGVEVDLAQFLTWLLLVLGM